LQRRHVGENDFAEHVQASVAQTLQDTTRDDGSYALRKGKYDRARKEEGVSGVKTGPPTKDIR
jgi:hypothetical protein